MKVIKVILPKTWNELTDKQLERMGLLFYSGLTGKLFDIKVFFILMDVSRWQFMKYGKVLEVLANVPLSELKNHYSFIYKENNRTVFPKVIKTKKGNLYSPMDRITNLSSEEFAAAEDLHRLWHKEKHRRALEYLAAVLYSTSPNKRPHFEKSLLDENAKLFSKMPIGKLLAMEIAYFGCKNYIADRFPKAFPKTGKQATSNKRYGFGKVILQMSKGGSFGNHEKTRRTNIYTFLEEFEENLKTAK